MRTFGALFLCLFLCVSCDEASFRVETPDVEDGAVVQQTVFETNVISVDPAAVLTIQASHGTCAISGDNLKVIYTRTDLNHHGTDTCEFFRNVPCWDKYTIDFSVGTPVLEFDINNSGCAIL